MELKSEFEEWLLSLDEDYPDSDILDSAGGEYFYTTTKALYQQFTRIATLETKNAELLAALVEARESVAYWADYVSRYFQEKHNVAGELAKIDAVIERNSK